jgi:hypothetical protein
MCVYFRIYRIKSRVIGSIKDLPALHQNQLSLAVLPKIGLGPCLLWAPIFSKRVRSLGVLIPMVPIKMVNDEDID